MSDIPPTVPPATPPPPGGGSYTPPPPPPSGYSGGTGGAGGDRTLMVVLSYLWILALIPLLTKKEDPEVQWHAKHGLVILGAEIIAWIVLTIIGFAAGDIIGCGIGMVNCVVWIAFLVIRILCIVKGVNGQRFRIPGLSDFANKF
jgi:uncharacterized membrane protein